MWVAEFRVWQVAPGEPKQPTMHGCIVGNQVSPWPALGLVPSNGAAHVGC